MGCDIHYYIEAKIEGEWTLVWIPRNEKCEDRNYARFAALAGVRGDGPEALGLPDDISVGTRFWWDAENYHSASYLPIAEAVRRMYVADRDRDYGDPKAYNSIDNYFGWYVQELAERSETRVVFWFDS